jgi:cation transport ATPase
LRDGDGDAVKVRLSLDSVHNDSSATKHINQNLHPINCTLTFHRNLQRQKCRQSNKQTNKQRNTEANKPNKYMEQTNNQTQQKQANKTNKQTTRNQNKHTNQRTTKLHVVAPHVLMLRIFKPGVGVPPVININQNERTK